MASLLSIRKPTEKTKITKYIAARNVKRDLSAVLPANMLGATRTLAQNVAIATARTELRDHGGKRCLIKVTTDSQEKHVLRSPRMKACNAEQQRAMDCQPAPRVGNALTLDVGTAE